MKMFNLLLVMAGLLSVTFLYGQDRNWEVGWQVFNTHSAPPGLVLNSGSHSAILNGMLIKHRTGSFKQRLNIQYLTINDGPKDNFCCDRVVNNGQYEGMELSLGIEKGDAFGPFEYYVLLDLGIGMGQFQGTSAGGFSSFIERYNLRYRSIGAYPGGGLSAWIKKRVAINWELRWPGVFYKTSGTYEGDFNGARAPNSGMIWQDGPESFFNLLVIF